ncbi:uncharacterized protein I206_100345 [Kwoniella pini CBS 10737]|uniref:3'-5' exonuclease domain-containing protein n=1 Tax=Kwoniella pini CBS 10737 TaxID=1296096 RepID=A0A1B9IE24_9TREE|nr:uncharacterized protein I206_00980 [Kwoniella pini CBS 10737]OCF53674.1 hypothetical protein I206_00980 [Kwoniella pini CBS 10737]
MSNKTSTSISLTSKDAPNPIDNFAEYLPHLTSALDNLTNHASKLPSKSDLSFHRTLDRKFANDLDSASERILKLTERLLKLVDQSQIQKSNKSNKSGTGKSRNGLSSRRKLEDEDDVLDGYKQGVVGVVDGLLEDADTCLDDLSGQKKKAAIAVKPHLAAKAGEKLPGPFSKQASRLPQNILHAADIPKPQLLFDDVPDNIPTTSPWKPAMTVKAHSMVPLNFVPELDYQLSREEELDPSKEYWRREREIRLRQHPYYYETKHLPYPTSLFINTPPVQPKSFQDTPFTFVDTPEQLNELTEHLKSVKEIAVDLEHHNMRSYFGFTCLIQITTRAGDWVIDSLKLRKELREDKLGNVFTDPSIIKVFHGSDSDIVWLQHDFEIFVVNLFDTYHATVVLGHQKRSLAGLLQTYCNFEADKRYQMADWRIRPLPEGMLHYARSDTHYLLYIYDNLRNALLEQSSRPPTPDPNGNEIIVTTRRNPQQAMRDVLGRSADTALRLFEKDEYNEETGKGSGGWMSQARKWLSKDMLEKEPGWQWRKIHAWRDKLARELDESPIFIMPQDVLKTLALLKGTAPILVKQAVNPARAPLAAKRIDEIAEVIKAAKIEWAATQTEFNRKNEELAEAAKAKKLGIIQQSQKRAEENLIPVPDVWDAITVLSTSQTAPSTSKSASTSKGQPKSTKKSGLFGSTITSNTKSPSSPPSTNVAKSNKLTSSLFGKTLSNSSPADKGRKPRNKRQKELSPGFENVQNSIHGELAPKKIDMVDVGSPVMVKPEQVPYVPPTERITGQTQVQGFSSSSKAPQIEGADQSTSNTAVVDTLPKKMKEEEGIVQVKKARKPKRERNGSSSIPSTASEGKKVKLDTPPIEDVLEKKEEIKVKKVKKPKVKAQDIPEFDYSSVPNLLDQPHSVIDGGKDKKKKKDKKQKDKKGGSINAIEAPTFGARAARDMSGPKGGNKSGTFTG